MNRKLRLFLFSLIFCGAAAAVWVGVARWQVESRHQSVELVADWRQVQQLAALSNVPMDQLLRELHKHGIEGMAVSEDTIAGLRDDASITIEADPQPDGGARTLVSSFDEELLARIQMHLLPKLNRREPLAATRTPEGNPAFIWPGSYEQIRTINVGLPPREVRRLQEADFDVVARIVNYQAANPANIEWSLRNLTGMGIGKVIFGGEEVLGYKAHVKETARLLQQLGLTYGSVEFSRQRGDESLSRSLRGNYLRVHSITPAEMNKLQPAEMVERFVRAAEERNIRIAFVRFLPFVTENGWEDQFEFLGQIRAGLDQAGLSAGRATPFGEPVLNPTLASVLRWVIGIGTAAAAAVLLTLIVPLGEGLLFLLFCGMALVHLGLLAGTQDLGRKLVALEAAILFPTLSLVWLYGYLRYRIREERGFPALGIFLAVSAVSALGGLYVVGLLSSRDYMLKAQQFVGIKAAHFLPLLMLAVLFSLDFVADQRSREGMIADARRRVQSVLSQPLLIWQLLAALLGMFAVSMLLLRTGNDPGVGVSSLEMRFRSLLDQILYVRPRTKEFLIGHPALVLALLWAAMQARRLASPAHRPSLHWGALVLLLLAGAIGQVSLVNTFCHIHTPLAITLVRVINGLWTGALIGFLIYWILPKSRARAAEPVERGIPVESGR